MRRLIAIIIGVCMTLTSAWAQHEGSHKQEGSHKDTAAASDDMKKMQEMMEAWAKVATPGDKHAVLDSMVGEWEVDGKFRMSPDGEWMQSPSQASIEWVLGGRFVRQDVSAEPSQMFPQPFKGIGYVGYDNGAQQYVSAWMDTMSTILLHAEGPGEGGKIALKGSYLDALTNQEKNFKWVYSIDSKDQFTLTMYEPGPDGEMFENAQLTYRRKHD